MTTEEKSTQSAEESRETSADIETLIAEAEERGYLRARQELAQQKFDAPTPGDEPAPPHDRVPPDPIFDFLSRDPRSIWDL